jgi:hypothetical protein
MGLLHMEQTVQQLHQSSVFRVLMKFYEGKEIVA